MGISRKCGITDDTRRPWHARRIAVFVAPLIVACVGAPISAAERIEEVVVTAERRESTVQDTAISITAFTEDFIEEFGLRNQEDLQAYIPATTIDPYDVSVRGVGRLFRALGGDPGVATYVNGAYSEDFGIASTEGGLYDVERIEVLRGPQGTLYGRNGVGGAVNFIYNKPTPEFRGEVRTVLGSEGTQELYGFVSGPLIPELLNYRVVGNKRERDGTVENIGIGDDLDGYGDENYALALQLTPTDSIEFNLRGNERSYRRVIASAQGAGAIVVSENGGLGDPITGGPRNTTQQVWGYRAVNPALPCASLTSRAAGANCAVPGRPILTFDHNGIVRTGQYIVPGVDVAPNSTGQRPNWAFQGDPAKLAESTIGSGRDVPDIDGDDLVVWQSGDNDEFFDHQAAYADATWDINDSITVKYIGAYTDYFYRRTTDDDLTANDPLDMQFMASQENENYQHEMQLFVDFTENLTLTAGAFYYYNQIDQRLDFYSEDLVRYTQAANYANLSTGDNPLVAGNQGLLPVMLNHNSAKLANKAGTCELRGLIPGSPQFSADSVVHVCSLSGIWGGEFTGDGNRTQHGPDSAGTSFIWDTENRSEATALYAQMEWQINEAFAVTLGGRVTTDDKEGEESLFLYSEEPCTAVAASNRCYLPDGTPVSLLQYNVNTGALNPDGTQTAAGLSEAIPVRFRGRPRSQSIYREVEGDYDETTWRANVDWTPNDATLIYLSATTGYRAGGFNLGYFSGTPEYDSEKILAYELGYKGQLLEGRLQVNAAIYHYEYEDIHAQFTVENPFLGGTNTSVRNMPEAENYGFEGDFVWLATDSLTLGGSFSYTHAEYTENTVDPTTGEAGVVDVNNPYAPTSLYTSDELRLPTDGLKLNRIPEYKYGVFGQYSWALGDRGRVDFLTSYSWQDDVTWDESESPIDEAPAFGRLDARATWNSADETWLIAAFVNNVFDEIGVRNEDQGAEAEGYFRTITPTLPRLYGMEARYRFGAR